MTAVLLSARTDIFNHYTHIYNNAGSGGDKGSASLAISDENSAKSRPTSTRQGTLTFAGGGRVVMSQAQARGRGTTAKTKKAAFESDDGDFGTRTGKGVKRGGARVNGGMAKRKAVDYDEDIEGFQFSRATATTTTSKRPKKSNEPTPSDNSTAEETNTRRPSLRKAGTGRSSANMTEAKISIQTPNGRPAEKAARQKSKRLADDAPSLPAEKQAKSRKKLHESEPATINVAKKKKPGKKKEQVAESSQRPQPERQAQNQGNEEVEDGDAVAVATPVDSAGAGTKIALPFADTPVMQRNKEMRKGKNKKRRSSFSLRGRRASSLIETGTSNALPHDKVDTADFYKHIASDGLSEPKRMKQLLTWCATRALGEKPSGSRSEDESARLAARVIQEELLKDIGDKPELSDWSSREETTPPALVVKKSNPKNEQNAEKIKELEEHIQRLQSERQSLAALLRPPSVPSIKPPPAERHTPQSTSNNADTTEPPTKSKSHLAINPSLLDPSQQALLKSISQYPVIPQPSASSSPTPKPDDPESDSTPTSINAISSRLSRLSTSLAPTLDSFASGIHNIELFRHSADDLASKILGICAHRLEERDLGLSTISGVPDDETREKEEEDERGKMDEDGDENQGTGEMKKKPRIKREREDLSIVLGALSRLERR